MIAAAKNTVKVTCISHTIYYFSAITFVVSGPCCFFWYPVFPSELSLQYHEIGCVSEIHVPIDLASVANVDAYKSGE